LQPHTPSPPADPIRFLPLHPPTHPPLLPSRSPPASKLHPPLQMITLMIGSTSSHIYWPLP
ncbi:hypothetical protein AVEN_179672-1, partial [Araneus ventricosus]